VLVSHIAVKEAAVYGVPDELRGQVAAAFIVLNPDVQPSDELKSEIKDHVRKVMGPIVVFKYVEFINVIPKTRSGKILRRIMSKLLLGEDLGDLSTIDEDASIDEVKEAISKFSPYVK
jgi:acetyl-CoA synthetase